MNEKTKRPRDSLEKKEMRLVLGEDLTYNMDSYKTKLNNNVCVVGASGSGKTEVISLENIRRADRNYVISDPKGNLYRKTKEHLESEGYKVLQINLSNPMGDVGYNPFEYVRTEHDVIKLAHMLMTGAGSSGFESQNAYFYQASELVLGSAIAGIKWIDECYMGPKSLQRILNFCSRILLDQNDSWPGDGDNHWADLSERLGEPFCHLPDDTASCVFSTIFSVLGPLNTRGVEKMLLNSCNKISIRSLTEPKTAIFVTVSDSDRSMDVLANIFFTQTIDYLCLIADTECENESLPYHVQFIMDDFATNATIEDYPRMISSIRSRNLSTILMIQSEGQLEKRFQKEAFTIIANCDSYLYMGGQDLETAKRVAARANLPHHRILSMPVGAYWLFRRGQKPLYGINNGLALNNNISKNMWG